MYRGTTPTITFRLPLQTSAITALSLTLRQKGVVIEKELKDVTLGENIVSVTLTEAETLKLQASADSKLEMQLRVGVGDARMASQIFCLPVERILRDGAL